MTIMQFNTYLAPLHYGLVYTPTPWDLYGHSQTKSEEKTINFSMSYEWEEKKQDREITYKREINRTEILAVMSQFPRIWGQKINLVPFFRHLGEGG